MISNSQARAQALRLSHLPQYQDRWCEIEQALQRNSSSVEHAARTVTKWLKSKTTAQLAPTGSELEALARLSDLEHDPLQWRCSACDNFGLELVHQLLTWRGENAKDVEMISEEHYNHLNTLVSGVTGEQVVATARKRCVKCDLGRRRAEEEKADREEARRKREGSRATSGAQSKVRSVRQSF